MKSMAAPVAGVMMMARMAWAGGGDATRAVLVVNAGSPASLRVANEYNSLRAVPIPTSGFTRISICQDLSVSPPKFAVFVAGNLVAQGLSAPASGINRYSSFAVDNLAGPACYMDDVLIAPALPSGLTNDLNHDGIADAYELNTYGFGLTASWPPSGTVFKIR